MNLVETCCTVHWAYGVVVGPEMVLRKLDWIASSTRNLAPAKRVLRPTGTLVVLSPAVLGTVGIVQFLEVCFAGGLGTH